MQKQSFKQFVFNALLLENTFDNMEKEGIPIRIGQAIQPILSIDEYDFSPRIRNDANKMSSIYVGFFCLENSVRELIVQRLSERKGIDWWENFVPKKIQENVQRRKTDELKKKYHYAQRSSTDIGYVTFGNLAQIITCNWEDFSDLFPDQAWISSRFNDLETSRNIIMHSGVLPEIEIDRIESIVRDWIRQVG